MANDNNIRLFTASDIEKYHKGLLSPKEMHDLERAALDDPFLADAIEGYSNAAVQVDRDIDELKARLADKAGKGKVIPMTPRSGPGFPWLRAAVILLLVFGAGLIAFQLLNRSDIRQKAVAEKSPAQSHTDTSAPETGLTAKNVNQDQYSSNSVSAQVDTGLRAKRRDDETFGALTWTDNKAIADSEKNGYYKRNIKTDDIASAPSVAKSDDKKSLEIVSSYSKTTVIDTTSVSSSLAANKPPVLNRASSQLDKDEMMAGVTARQKAAPEKNKEVQGFAESYNYNNINTFHGRVTDNNNNALPFANITNSRDNVGTYSDAQGNFTLVSTDSIMNVQIRSLGFMNKSVQLKNSLAANRVTLQEDRALPIDTLDKVKRNIRRSRNNSMTLEDPEPEDGWDSYSYYVMNNLNIPESYDMKPLGETLDNTVEVSFEVNKNGEPVNIKIEKSLCDKCDQEAKRLIKDGPKWKRKTKKSKRTTVSIPFIKQD